MTNETHENAKRLLVLMYDMAKGSTVIELKETDVSQEAEKLRLFDMTEVEFETYRMRVRDRMLQRKREAS